MNFSKIIVLFALSTTLWAANPFIGTWKLNIAKSQYTSGPAPKSATITYEATPDGLKRTGETVDAEGKSTSLEYTAKYNGGYYPITGSDLYDEIAMRATKERIAQATLKKSGKIVAHVRREVSEDGKTLTLTISRTDAKGRKTRDIAVYEKQ